MDQQGIIPSLAAEAERPFSAADSIELRRKLCGEPPPYDPVAVLEAMREAIAERWTVYGFSLGVWDSDADDEHQAYWRASFTFDRNINVDVAEDKLFPDFTSAVRWLHQQAAAADKTFAEKWPVPE